MTQADITVAVFWLFARGKRPNFFAGLGCTKLDALAERLQATPAFQATMPESGDADQRACLAGHAALRASSVAIRSQRFRIMSFMTSASCQRSDSSAPSGPVMA